MLFKADALGCDLPGDIDLHRGVDGIYIVVLRDDVGIVGVREFTRLAEGIVVQKITHPLTAHGKAEGGYALVYLLHGVIYSAALDKFDHGLNEHLGMDAEVEGLNVRDLVAQIKQHTGPLQLGIGGIAAAGDDVGNVVLGTVGNVVLGQSRFENCAGIRRRVDGDNDSLILFRELIILIFDKTL